MPWKPILGSSSSRFAAWAKTRAVHERCPNVAIVALTAAAGEHELQALLDAGAVAYVRKDEPLDTIVEAVRAAAPVETD